MATIKKKAMMDLGAIRGKIQKILDQINTRVVGMPEVVRGVALAMLAGNGKFGEHLFLIGPPGVGKSYVMDTWISCIDIDEEQFYSYLFHQFSPPDELIGEVDIAALLSDQHVKRRDIGGYLPTAVFAVLDEIWKSGPVTTSLFKIMNERTFRNGKEEVNCPLISALAASNEYPSNKMDAPLWDRLLFRYYVGAVWEPEGVKQIQAAKRVPWDPEVITLPEIYAAKRAAWAVEVPKDVEDALINVTVALMQAGIELSNRRRDKLYGVVRASAWLNGRDVAVIEDIGAIWPCCWENDKQIKQVRKIIAKITNFELDRMMTEFDVTEQIYRDAQKLIAAYQGSQNASALGDIDELEEKVACVLTDFRKRRETMTPANRVEADDIIAKIALWHRELIPYAMKRAETRKV